MATSAATLTLFGFFCILSTLTDATAGKPKVSIHVTANDIPVGSTGLLLCTADQSATFRWQKDGEEIETRIESSEEKSKLHLQNVKLTDSGEYKCICDFDGDEYIASTNIYVYEKPSFGPTQTYHEFLVNQTVRVPCQVTGKPEVETNWYWNGDRVLNNDTDNLSVLSDRSLLITNIQRENHGTYACEGKIKGRPKSETLNISVVVNAPPTAIVRGERTNVLAGPNRNVTLICLVTGAPKPNITWEMSAKSDSSRYIYNSDKSMLIIPDVARSDSGNYACTARNKIGEARSTFTLDVSERPSVTLSRSELVLKLGESASVFCNATGHPPPTIQWMNKSKEGGMLQINNVVSSHGGVYSCKATSAAGSDTQSFKLMTSPEVPTSFAVSPGPSAFHITLQKPVLDGGSPITHYIIQWRKESKDDWIETSVPFPGPLEVKSLAPYTEYAVRFAAKNKYFLGAFSTEQKIRTLAKREPDMPEVSVDDGKIDKNSYTIPVKQIIDGSSPIQYYVIRYRMNKEGEPWREKTTDTNSSIIHLQNLEYDSNYEAEIIAVNVNGSSEPAKLYFSIPQAQPSLGKGGVVAIVLVVFLVLLVGVDALCCYTNHCGMLNFLARKLFGPNVSESKGLEEGVFNNTAVTMNGLEKARGSIPKLQSQNKTENGMQSDITCDKAPLTKFAKAPAEADPVNEARL